MPTTMTDEKAEQLGLALIHLLDLRAKRNERVDTAHGDKTVIGLGRTVLRVVEEELADTRHKVNLTEPPFGRQHLNEKEWQHSCQNGSNFTCKRCDFRAPIVVTNWPRSQSGELDGEAFASDVSEMIGYHAVNVLGDNQLDLKQGFQGYDCLRWDLK